jgi:hypothetical protein
MWLSPFLLSATKLLPVIFLGTTIDAKRLHGMAARNKPDSVDFSRNSPRPTPLMDMMTRF